MCRYISAFYRMCPELEVKVGCLYSHGITEQWTGVKPDSEWAEMHYLPNGSIVCYKKPAPFVPWSTWEPPCLNYVAEQAVQAKWPTFTKFESWAIKESRQYYPDGWDQYGFDRQGYDQYGFDRQGYDPDGFDREGLFNSNDVSWYDHGLQQSAGEDNCSPIDK